MVVDRFVNRLFVSHGFFNGLGGNLEAKLTGFRHLARYTTRTYQEPIKARVKFDNNNCLHCHEQAPKWLAVESHTTALKEQQQAAAPGAKATK